MKLTIIAKPGAKEYKVFKVSETQYRVSVKEPAKEGRANWSIERELAKYFKIPVSRVRIIQGLTNKTKVAEIL
jgi:uncharacterized protein YggU (UPF0235/DUF167 family)